jgi:hypothetical protein
MVLGAYGFGVSDAVSRCKSSVVWAVRHGSPKLLLPQRLVMRSLSSIVGAADKGGPLTRKEKEEKR